MIDLFRDDHILRKHGGILLIAVALAASASYAVSYLQKEVYQATAIVSIVPVSSDADLGNVADLLQNFATTIATAEVAGPAIAQAQLDTTPQAFLQDISLVPDASTFSLRIVARDADPDVATTMALALAQGFVDERTTYYAQRDRSERMEVKLISRSLVPQQVQPSPWFNALAGAVLGLLWGIGLVLFLAWTELALFRTPEAVERGLGVRVLASIPRIPSRT